MTLAAVARKAGPYTGTGVATTFSYGFQIVQASDLDVYIDDALQPLSAYSVTGVGTESGGTIILTTAPASGTIVWIFGSLPIAQQDVDLLPGGAINNTNLELSLDKFVMMMWERVLDLERRPALKAATLLRNLVFPDPVASTLIGWNATADALALSPATITTVTPDPVTGLTFVKTNVIVNSSDGLAQLTASNAFPAGSVGLYCVARITTAFGASNGLTALALGDGVEGEDIWTASMAITLDAVSNVGQHRTNVMPLANASARDVLITAIGGPFDATGTIKLTTVSVTVTPDA